MNEMQTWQSRICACLLALAMLPGAFEILENATHLATEGHLAHAVSHQDRHEPTGPEHGCTPIFHFCGCHASLAFLAGSPPPVIHLYTAGLSNRRVPALQPAGGFWPAIDRPPRV